MAKLSPHQMDGTYYTRTYEGGIVTRQIHPDGVAYLKHCRVRVDGEIPKYCMSELRDYGWLFTKEEMSFWGEVDWSPHWSRVQAKPLSTLMPFRRVVSVAEWGGAGVYKSPPSSVGVLDDRAVDVQERIELQHQAMLRSIQAEIDADRRQREQKREAERIASESSEKRRQAEAREHNRNLADRDYEVTVDVDIVRRDRGDVPCD